MFTMKKLALGAVLGVAAIATTDTQAADWDVNFSFGSPRHVVVAPQTHVHREWIPGRYETRTEQILVSPERHEKVWVPPVYETRYERHRGHYHTEQVLVRQGYFKEVCIPARYETCTKQVWIPGCYKEVVHTARPSYRDGYSHDQNGPIHTRPVYNSPRGGYVSVDFRK